LQAPTQQDPAAADDAPAAAAADDAPAAADDDDAPAADAADDAPAADADDDAPAAADDADDAPAAAEPPAAPALSNNNSDPSPAPRKVCFLSFMSESDSRVVWHLHLHFPQINFDDIQTELKHYLENKSRSCVTVQNSLNAQKSIHVKLDLRAPDVKFINPEGGTEIKAVEVLVRGGPVAEGEDYAPGEWTGPPRRGVAHKILSKVISVGTSRAASIVQDLALAWVTGDESCLDMHNVINKDL
jgi:hypothetical protein